MAEIETGGPAFPAEGGEASGLHPNPGMSLRDYFAGQALPQVIHMCFADRRLDGETSEQMFARKAYAIADAMLTERAKGGQ